MNTTYNFNICLTFYLFIVSVPYENNISFMGAETLSVVFTAASLAPRKCLTHLKYVRNVYGNNDQI